ncbi:MAG: SIS domain-containing protein [Rhodothermales bacterium]|nr:SIS domain-containing protein [Rhodothermales bacterium]
MLGASLDFESYVSRIGHEMNRIDADAVRRWADVLFDAWDNDKTVYVVGNGGSATSATHFSQDLAKSTLRTDDLYDETKKRLRIISLTDNVGWMLAVANDLDYDQIFVQQLMTLASRGDLVIAISGSGNSSNVVKAVDWAKRSGLRTFGLTGFDGGQVDALCDDGVHVDLDDMGMVESLHLTLFHWVLNDVYARINSEGRYAVGSHSGS